MDIDKSNFSNISLDKINNTINTTTIKNSLNDNSNHYIPTIEKLTQVGREATKFDFESLHNSNDCEFGYKRGSEDLQAQIVNYDLHQYYIANLANKKSFFKIIPKENIMKYSDESISSPLTRLPSQLHSTATRIYEELMCYMMDKATKKKPSDHTKTHLKIVLNATEDLKDEAYVQVLKQISNHPDINKTFRGWNFLAILSSSFPPSSELYYSLLNYFIHEIKNNLDERIVKHANYIFYRLIRIFDMRRKQIPSDDELLHIEHMKPIMFPVFFFF